MHTKKLSLIVVLIILAVQAFLVGAHDNSPSVSVVPDASQATAGQEFTATIQVSGAHEVYGSSFKLTFDPQAFEVVQVDNQAVVPGAFFEGAPGFTLKNMADPTTGLVEYAMTLMQPAEPVSGDGVLGVVTFRALKDAPVAITATEASLVSPEFVEVDGRKVAQHINQVAANIVEASPVEAVVAVPATAVPTVEAPVASPNTASVASAASESTTVTDADLAASMFNNPALNEQPVVEQSSASVAQVEPTVAQPRTNIGIIVAGMFFALGLVFLTVSVGVYSRMRVRINMMPEMRREQVF